VTLAKCSLFNDTKHRAASLRQQSYFIRFIRQMSDDKTTKYKKNKRTN